MIKPIDLQEPDAKLLYKGSHALSDTETLALILAGMNPASKVTKLLESVQYNFTDLGKYSYDELMAIGLSHLQAVRLIAVLEFSRRKALQVAEQNPKISCSRDAYNIFRPFNGDLQHEEFYCMYLNRANIVIKTIKLSQGGLSGTVTDVRIILREALLLRASGLIVCHNHPSGNLNPSESDSKVTKKIKESASVMDISLLDHIIISGGDYYSFADNGLI